MPTKSYPHARRIWQGTWSTTGNLEEPASNHPNWGVLSGTDYVTTGANIPGWRQRIANGVSATTSLEGVRLHWDRATLPLRVFVKARNNATGQVYSYTSFSACRINSFPSHDGEVFNSAKNEASTAFYKALKSKHTLFEGGVFGRELGETLRMIRNPAQALRRGVDDLISDVKKRWKGQRPVADPLERTQRRLKQAGEAYLEHAFGWAPLINDLDDAAKYVNRRKRQLTRQGVFVRGTGKAEKSNVQYYRDGAGLCYLRTIVETQHTTNVVYVARLADEAVTTPPSMMESLGLGLNNFVPTVWECLPYSFLIDYFTNVGDVLTAYSQRKVKFAWGWTGSHQFTSMHNQIMQPETIDMYANYKLLESSVSLPLEGKSTRTTVKRDPITSVPLPDISYKIPGSGSTKWINIGALLAAKVSVKP